jgi:hypothetical protein
MLTPMTLLNLARVAGSALGVGLVASACSSTPAQPQAFVKLVMTSSNTFPGMCVGYPSDTTIMQVGEPGDPNVMPAIQPTRVTTGASSVLISCSVHPTGSDNFQVDLAISQGDVSGMGSSSLTVSGVVNSSTGGTNVDGNVSTTVGGGYQSKTCNVTFTTLPGTGASPSGPPVDAGRIWAHLSCDGIQDPSITTQSGGLSTCDAEVDFIFENCGT